MKSSLSVRHLPSKVLSTKARGASRLRREPVNRIRRSGNRPGISGRIVATRTMVGSGVALAGADRYAAISVARMAPSVSKELLLSGVSGQCTRRLPATNAGAFARNHLDGWGAYRANWNDFRMVRDAGAIRTGTSPRLHVYVISQKRLRARRHSRLLPFSQWSTSARFAKPCAGSREILSGSSLPC